MTDKAGSIPTQLPPDVRDDPMRGLSDTIEAPIRRSDWNARPP